MFGYTTNVVGGDGYISRQTEISDIEYVVLAEHLRYNWDWDIEAAVVELDTGSLFLYSASGCSCSSPYDYGWHTSIYPIPYHPTNIRADLPPDFVMKVIRLANMSAEERLVEARGVLNSYFN